MFEDLFNFKKKEESSPEVEKEAETVMKDILEDTIVRVAFNNIDENSYRPVPYAIIEEEEDLFENQEKFDKVKKEIKEALKEADPNGAELKNYTILEFPYNSVEQLFFMESEFALLNTHLQILPEKTTVIDIMDAINDPSTSASNRFKLLALNYGIKIYNLLNPAYRGASWEMYKKHEDIHIMSNGAVEKYVFDLFHKYKVVMYKVSEE